MLTQTHKPKTLGAVHHAAEPATAAMPKINVTKIEMSPLMRDFEDGGGKRLDHAKYDGG